MADMYCTKCGEPWDTHHVRNEAFDGDAFDGASNMPPSIRALWEAWVDTDTWSGTDEERAARDRLGLAYYNTGLSKGCTACWWEPERVTEASQEEGLRRALFDGVWDGDPTEFFA